MASVCQQGVVHDGKGVKCIPLTVATYTDLLTDHVYLVMLTLFSYVDCLFQVI